MATQVLNMHLPAKFAQTTHADSLCVL